MPFQQIPQMDFRQLEADRVKALEQTPKAQPDRLPAYSEAIQGRLNAVNVVEKAKKQQREQEQKSQSNSKKSGKFSGLKSILKGETK